MKKLVMRADFIIIAVILLAAVLLLAFRPKEIGKTATVRVDGEEYKTLNLESEEKTEITVNGVSIVCDSGEIYIKESTCRDRVCVNAGHISKKGQSAVCVPNRVSVEIKGKDKDAPQVVTG